MSRSRGNMSIPDYGNSSLGQHLAGQLLGRCIIEPHAFASAPLAEQLQLATKQIYRAVRDLSFSIGY